MSRIIVNVATDSYVYGQIRLRERLESFGEVFHDWCNALPPGCPPHRTRGLLGGLEDTCRPYAFKAYAMKAAADAGYTSILWLDASILPQHPLTRVWEEIESKGYWIPLNGWTNDQWTADSAYPDLFPGMELEEARAVNKTIPHAVGTAFGLDLRFANAAVFLHEYYRLASKTRAFCGPWQNENAPHVAKRNQDRTVGYAGPYPPVEGHRHDQTAISVLAWRLKMQLATDRTLFAYKTENAEDTKDTVLLAVGA